MSPFRIKSFVDDKLVMTLNEGDTLYFEKSIGKQEFIQMNPHNKKRPTRHGNESQADYPYYDD